MIQLFHVYKSYGAEAHALLDVNLEIEKGEFAFLTGPSGAGKTTLLRLLFVADVPTRGQLLLNGKNTARLGKGSIPYLRRNLGVVFQDFKLLPRRTVEDNVAVTLEVTGTPRHKIQKRVFAVLRQVGLAHKLHQYPLSLSGGEQQRVAIARALVNEPQLLLADEPTGNLDSERASEIMELLEDANARGTTVLVATHDRELIERANKRIIRLEAGRVVSS